MKWAGILTVISLSVLGCGPLHTRSAIPADRIESATIEGYGAIRYWGDEPSEQLTHSIVESWHQERATLGLGEGPVQFPPSHYLAISGGGEDGAFGAGVLCGWTKTGTRPAFKVVTGISTGALTAPFAFLGSDYDDSLREIYTTVNEEDIAIFQGLLSILRSDSVYNTAPLSRLAERCFTAEMVEEVAREHRKGRRLFIGTTHLDAQRPMVWDMGAIACSERKDRVALFRKVLLASAAIPAAFPPVYIKVKDENGQEFEEMHVDGGVTREMFLLPSELRLYELRAQAGVKRKTHLHIIRNGRMGSQYEAVHPRVGAIAERSIATLIKAQAAGDLLTLYYEAVTHDVHYALTSIPDHFIDDSKTMFDSEYMTRLFDQGYGMATDGTAWRDKPFRSTKKQTTHPTVRERRAEEPAR